MNVCRWGGWSTSTRTPLGSSVNTDMYRMWAIIFPGGVAVGRVLVTNGLLALVDPGRRASPLAGQPGYEQPVVRSDLSVCAHIRQPSSD